MHIRRCSCLCVEYEVGSDRDKVPLSSPRRHIRLHPALNDNRQNSIIHIMEGRALKRQTKEWETHIGRQQFGDSHCQSTVWGLAVTANTRDTDTDAEHNTQNFVFPPQIIVPTPAVNKSEPTYIHRHASRHKNYIHEKRKKKHLKPSLIPSDPIKSSSSSCHGM